MLLATNANAALFSTVEFKSNNLSSLPKWTSVLKKVEKDLSYYKLCDKLKENCSHMQFSEWSNFVNKTKNITNKEQLLNRVNSFFNTWDYTLDIDLWGVNDYWEIPSEFLSLSGDCEDYAIIKYYTLKKLGFDVNNLRIVILKDTVRNGAHAVLAVYLNNKTYILDNLSSAVLTDDVLTQYVPYYSINETNKWIHFKKL